MSEQKKLRSIEEVQSEYHGLAQRAGHAQYQVFAFQKEVDLLNEKLRDLNFEAAAISNAKKEADEKAKADAATKLEEVKNA